MKNKHHTKKDDKKPENLKKELEEKTELAEERLNQIKYLQAEFENYKKRLDIQRVQFESLANQGLVRELLPIIDDLEAATEKSGNIESQEGYKIILKKLLGVLLKSGLKPIESVGRNFDPYYHEAMMSMESEEPEGTVTEEVQKGYTFHSKVIRHSKVKIARNKKPESKKRGEDHER
jgi:molecular chaperone GrpE